MRNFIFFIIITFFSMDLAQARTATTKEEFEAESQVQSTKGDLGERALQKQEDVEVDPMMEENPEFDPDIIIREEKPGEEN